MNDRTTKALLAAVALLLAALLVRPTVRAQAPPPPPPPANAAGPVAITASNNLIYVVRGNEMSVLYLDMGLKGATDVFRLLEQDGLERALKDARLRLLVRQDLDKLRAEAK